MNINPNLKNPLALFALCFMVVESIIIALLIYKVQSIELCHWIIAMLFIFVVAFPIIVFFCFYVLLCVKYEVLFSPIENAYAQLLTQNKKEKTERVNEKLVLYGIDSAILKETETVTQKNVNVIPSEKSMLEKYISTFAPFLHTDVKIRTKEGIRYFDAYANWNGHNYVVEVKCLRKWTPSCLRGVEAFVSNARYSSFPIHMTLILYIEEAFDKEKTIRDIHEIEPALNIVFASGDSTGIAFSSIS